MNDQATSKICPCKGIRTCLICEPLKITPTDGLIHQLSGCQQQTYYYCIQCKSKAWLSKDHDHHTIQNHQESSIQSSAEFIEIGGIFVAEEAISKSVEEELVQKIEDSVTWAGSQSGRRKQDYGPKINFKRKICKLGSFQGLPKYACEVFAQLQSNHPSELFDFVPVELCNLEYLPERGSAIDPHLDDVWVWGNRLVTINLLSATVLTLSRIPGAQSDFPNDQTEIAIEMPNRSLLVLKDEARYQWHHSIKRTHINCRRIAMTWREFTPLFMPGGEQYENVGKRLLEVASNQI